MGRSMQRLWICNTVIRCLKLNKAKLLFFFSFFLFFNTVHGVLHLWGSANIMRSEESTPHVSALVHIEGTLVCCKNSVSLRQFLCPPLPQALSGWIPSTDRPCVFCRTQKTVPGVHAGRSILSVCAEEGGGGLPTFCFLTSFSLIIICNYKPKLTRQAHDVQVISVQNRRFKYQIGQIGNRPPPGWLHPSSFSKDKLTLSS